MFVLSRGFVDWARATAFEISRKGYQEKDIKKAQRIQSGGKALFLDTDPAAKVSILAERQSSFTQHIQVERGHIFTGPGAILVKDNIQTPVQLILYGPMLGVPHRQNVPRQ